MAIGPGRFGSFSHGLVERAMLCYVQDHQGRAYGDNGCNENEETWHGWKGMIGEDAIDSEPRAPCNTAAFSCIHRCCSTRDTHVLSPDQWNVYSCLFAIET